MPKFVMLQTGVC